MRCSLDLQTTETKKRFSHNNISIPYSICNHNNFNKPFFKVPVHLPPSLSDFKNLTGDSSKEGLWKLMQQVRKGEEMW
jgi:hypothetical protein